MNGQTEIFYSFDSGWWFLQWVIVLVLSGWVFARVQQNGYPVTKRSVKQFAGDMWGFAFFSGFGSFLILMLGTVLFSDGFLIALGMMLLIVISGIIVAVIIFGVLTIITKVTVKLAPYIMRKDNEDKLDFSY